MDEGDDKTVPDGIIHYFETRISNKVATWLQEKFGKIGHYAYFQSNIIDCQMDDHGDLFVKGGW